MRLMASLSEVTVCSHSSTAAKLPAARETTFCRLAGALAAMSPDELASAEALVESKLANADMPDEGGRLLALRACAMRRRLGAAVSSGVPAGTCCAWRTHH